MTQAEYKKQLIISSVAIVLGIIIFYFIIFQSRISKIDELRDQKIKITNDINKYRIQDSEIKKIKREFDSIISRLNKSDKVIINNSEVQNFIYQITEIANSTIKKDIQIKQGDIVEKDYTYKTKFVKKKKEKDSGKRKSRFSRRKKASKKKNGKANIKKYKEISISLKFKCNYKEFGQYIKALETMKSLYVINNLVIETELDNLKINMDIILYLS